MNKEEAGVGEEEKVVLNMLSDLAQDTVVILGKDKIKAQTEDDLKAKNLEWECFKKKNEDWKEMLAYQRANPICITLDGNASKRRTRTGRRCSPTRGPTPYASHSMGMLQKEERGLEGDARLPED